MSRCGTREHHFEHVQVWDLHGHSGQQGHPSVSKATPTPVGQSVQDISDRRRGLLLTYRLRLL